MLKSFICPDGQRCGTEDCLTMCRMNKRCISLPTLQTIALGDRKWDGVSHVTNLLNGTLEEYLKIKHDYAIKPEGRAYALLGSGHHALLEDHTLVSKNWLSEFHLTCSFMQGTADLIIFNDGGKTFTILDYKTWGSYKVAKVLGIVKASDKKSFIVDPAKVDMSHEILQLNAYRYMTELIYPEYKCKELTIQTTVRDGGVMIANSRGITKPIYMIDIPIIPNYEVEAFFKPRAELLLSAVRTGDAVVCTNEERWYGKKCAEYCDVAEFCPIPGLLNGE
jgi:hypothetical protein